MFTRKKQQNPQNFSLDIYNTASQLTSVCFSEQGTNIRE